MFAPKYLENKLKFSQYVHPGGGGASATDATSYRSLHQHRSRSGRQLGRAATGVAYTSYTGTSPAKAGGLRPEIGRKKVASGQPRHWPPTPAMAGVAGPLASLILHKQLDAGRQRVDAHAQGPAPASSPRSYATPSSTRCSPAGPTACACEASRRPSRTAAEGDHRRRLSGSWMQRSAGTAGAEPLRQAG